MWNPWRVCPPMTSNALKIILRVHFTITFNQNTEALILYQKSLFIAMQCVRMHYKQSRPLSHRTYDAQYHVHDETPSCTRWCERNPVAFVFFCPCFPILLFSLILFTWSILVIPWHFFFTFTWYFTEITPNIREKHVTTEYHQMTILMYVTLD